MGTSDIIALCSVGLAALVLLASFRRDTRSNASSSATTNAKLDAIAGGVDEIRIEQRLMRDKQDATGERVATLEASYKSLHKRLDMHERNSAHPPGMAGRDED